MSNRSSKNEVSWSRAGEGVTVLVWGRTEGGPGGKFGEGKLVLDSLEVLRSEWADLAAAIEDDGGSHGRADVPLPDQESWARLVAASSRQKPRA